MRNAEMAGSKARGLPVGTNDPDLSYTESFPAAQCSPLRQSRRVLSAVPRRERAPGRVPRGSSQSGCAGQAGWPPVWFRPTVLLCASGRLLDVG